MSMVDARNHDLTYLLIRLRLMSLVIIVTTSLSPTVVLAQTPSAIAIAQMQYEEGIQLYDSGEHEEALQVFQESLTMVPSPNSRLYVARCLRELGRNAEAVSEYLLTARAAADRAIHDLRYEQTRVAAESEREALLSQIAWITMTLPMPLSEIQLEVDSRSIPIQALDLPLPVDPGEIIIRAQASGFHNFEQRLTITAEERRTVTLELEPLPDERDEEVESSEIEQSIEERRDVRRRPLIVSTFVSGGLALANGIAFAVLASLANDLYDELSVACGDGPCPADRQGDVERGQSLEIGAYVTLGLALGTAVLSGILALVTPWRRSQESSFTGGPQLGGAGVTARW